MHIETFARTLGIQFAYTSYVFNASLDGFGEDEALVAPAGGGNGANWIAGHIVHTRGAILRMLGQDSPFPAAKYARYDRGSEPLEAGDPGYVPLAALVEDFGATEAPLRAGLEAMTPELLSAKAPFSPGNDPDETVGSLLAGLVFHESYHTGQIGLLRRMAGHDSAVP